MAVYHGRNGRLYASVSGTTDAIPIASLNAWSVDLTTDKVETTSFGDANKTYVQGLPDVSGTFAGFWDSAVTTLWTGASSTDGVKMYLYPSTSASSKYLALPAWLDMSIATGVGDAVTVSGNFSANGSVTNKLGA